LYETDYTLDDEDIRLNVPLTKVDIDRRTVHGFATLDNLDKQDDVVPMEASIKAFEHFRGNIREMHQPLAVGKMISFKPESMYDQETGQIHNGVFVSAYISRGAQDTWEKIVDRTLSGFSIGGVIKESREVFDRQLDKLVRVIDEYELVELSLVDAPANPLANITLVQKVDGVLETPMIKGDLETIYMCPEDSVVKVSAGSEHKCPVCNTSMKDIGFVESNDAEKAGIIKTVVTKFIHEKEANNMAEQNDTEVVEKSEVEDVVEETAEEETEAVETEAVEEPVEEVAKAEEQPDTVNELLIKSLETIASTLSSIADRVDGLEKSLTNKVAEVESGVSERIEEFGKRVDKVEDSTAFRKSGDLGEVAQETVVKTESVWGGSFLTAVADL